MTDIVRAPRLGCLDEQINLEKMEWIKHEGREGGVLDVQPCRLGTWVARVRMLQPSPLLGFHNPLSQTTTTTSKQNT